MLDEDEKIIQRRANSVNVVIEYIANLLLDIHEYLKKLGIEIEPRRELKDNNFPKHTISKNSTTEEAQTTNGVTWDLAEAPKREKIEYENGKGILETIKKELEPITGIEDEPNEISAKAEKQAIESIPPQPGEVALKELMEELERLASKEGALEEKFREWIALFECPACGKISNIYLQINHLEVLC